MFKRWIFAVIAVTCVAAAAAAAEAVPGVTPQEFPTDGQQAFFLWSWLAKPEIASLILAGIGAVAGWLKRRSVVKKWRMERGIEFLEAGAKETYEEYVRIVQKENVDGKLTVEERKKAMDMAITKAKAYCRQHGFDLAKVYAKEFLPVLVERIIGVQKAYGRAAPFPGLPDLQPQ